jgi:uncharacterized membrane protein YgcG
MRARGTRRYAAWRAASVVLGLAVLTGAGASVAGAAGREVVWSGASRAVDVASRAGLHGDVMPYDDLATKFHVDFTVNADGSVDVAEHITWHFPQGEERHGIERLVVVRAGYGQDGSSYREYPISAVSASSPTGAPSQVSESDTPDGRSVRIRVGDPQQTVSGNQEYVVRYHLDSIVNGFPDHAEFYYNLVDPASNSEYKDVSATVTGPAPSTQAECFHGELGSPARCQATPGATATFSAPESKPAEGVSILASLPREAFTGSLDPVVHEGQVADDGSITTTTGSKALGALAAGAGLTLPLLAAGLMGTLVYTRGRDERYAGLTPGLRPGVGDAPEVVRGGKPVVAVQFTPPQGVQPGMVGTVIDETVNTVDVSATLVDLAVRGHLTIEQIESGMFGRRDWRLTRTAPTAEQAQVPLHDYEQVLLDGVFAGGSQTTLSALRNEFKPTLDRVRSLMYDEVVRRGWFRRSPQAQRSGWTFLGGAMMVLPVVGFQFLGGSLWRLGSATGLPVPPGLLLAVGSFAAGAIVFFLGRRMAARTADGSAVLAQSEGFKQYLVTAEATQIKWEEAQDIFSRYLPYAIVFGVASQWAATFEKVAAAAAAAGHTLATPLWYVGSWSSFGGIADGMDSFATTAGGTFTSTPGSSGGSGFSSGGGFSGGGGGGSSGGSW